MPYNAITIFQMNTPPLTRAQLKVGSSPGGIKPDTSVQFQLICQDRTALPLGDRAE